MLVIATLLIPFAVTMIPLYLLWNALGQTNTYWPLIIPAWLASPLLRLSPAPVLHGHPPGALGERPDRRGERAADHVDGSSCPWRPGLAVVALFQFLGVWVTSWAPDLPAGQVPVHHLAGPAQHAERLRSLQLRRDHGAATITMLPVIVFFFTQRTFIQGITFSGIKG